MAKNNPTKKQIEKKSSNIEACTSVKTDRRENAKFIVKKRIDLHHKLQLPIRICFLLDYLLLFLKAFVADFEHVFVCWKRYRAKAIVVLILKYLAQQTNTYS